MLVSLLAGLADPVAALSQVWMDLEFGRSSHDLLASRLSSDDIVISLRYAGTPWVAISGAVPLSGSSGPWAATALGGEWLRPAAGPLSFGIAGTGQIYGFDAGTDARTGISWGFVAGAAPVLRIASGRGHVEVHSGPIVSWGDASTDAGFRRHHSSLAAAGLTALSGSTLEAVVRYVAADDRGYPFVGAGFSHSLSQGELWGHGGMWTAGSEDGLEWAAGASWNASSRFEVYASFQQEALDPVFRIAPRQHWTLGLSYALRTATPYPYVGLPLEVLAPASLIRIARAEVVSRPSIAGDFTGWTAVPMEQEGAFWVTNLDLPPGLYRFAFLDAEGNWFLPESVVHRVPDGFGGENGIIVVQ